MDDICQKVPEPLYSLVPHPHPPHTAFHTCTGASAQTTERGKCLRKQDKFKCNSEPSVEEWVYPTDAIQTKKGLWKGKLPEAVLPALEIHRLSLRVSL